MLKKLFVHEWKDCWRLVGLMNLIVIGLTLIGTVVMQSDTWSFASENAVIRLTMTLYVMAYIASIDVYKRQYKYQSPQAASAS